MFRNLFVATAFVLAASLSAQAGPKEDVQAAAKKLGDAENYSWKSTVEGGQQRRGPTEGKTQKDGLTMLIIAAGDNTMDVFIKGEKGAVKTADGWKSFEEASQDTSQQNPARFISRMARGFKAPAVQAQDLAGKTKELTKSEDAYSGELTEEGAKELLTFGRRRNADAANAPQVSNAKGTVKFWVKDGVLTKFETKVEAKMEFNGDEIDASRTTTTEIKEVGATKVNVPDAAKKKLS